MAKPFLLPDPGPGGSSTSSGAGPPATNSGGSSSSASSSSSGASSASVASGAAGGTAPPTSAPILIPPPGPPGHVPSAPIPMAAPGNAQYHLQQMHHHHQQLQHHYQSPYAGGPAALLVPGTPGASGAGDPHALLPMTPPASGFATAVHTPQMTPVNEQLVQALYEAICRCSLGDGPATPLSQSPPSASCSPFTNGSYYGSAQVFFPRTPASTTGGRSGGRVFFHQTPTPGPQYAQVPQSQPTPVSANSHSSSSGVSSSGALDTPSCSSGTPHYLQGGHLQPVQFNWHDDASDSSESEGSSSQATTSSSSSGCSPHCHGMDGASFSSTPSSTTLISPSSSGGTLYAAVPPHLDYMAGREQLQEFPGKIPQRKRKPRTPKPKKPGPLMWQVAVTAALIVLGCGYLAAR